MRWDEMGLVKGRMGMQYEMGEMEWKIVWDMRGDEMRKRCGGDGGGGTQSFERIFINF